MLDQPELRDPLPNERIVRTGGLRFILPNAFAEGDTLTPASAAFINAALHSAVINRFKDTRKVLEENPTTTYADIDEALQAFFAEFEVTPRKTKAPEPEADTDDEANAAFRALVKWARPDFNRAMSTVQGLPRKEYERLLREWVQENQPTLQAQMEAEQAAISRSLAKLADTLSAAE